LLDRARGDAETQAIAWRIPVDIYLDPLRYQQERGRLFLARPLILGHEALTRNPGMRNKEPSADGASHPET
jgi:hypothetical protein